LRRPEHLARSLLKIAKDLNPAIKQVEDDTLMSRPPLKIEDGSANGSN
jgi:hypothetical protein